MCCVCCGEVSTIATQAGHKCASEYLEPRLIDTVSPIPVKSAGGKDYEYRAVYVRPLQFKVVQSVAESKTGA